MKSQSNRRRDGAMFLVALLALLFIAGDHPLVEHWGDVAMSSNEEWGSKWIHTDTGGVRYGLYGESASNEARGVYGSATYTGSSGLAIGVVGESDAQTGRGVHGYASNGTGVSYGVTGATYSTDPTASGVLGFIARTTGSARGVQGKVISTNGVGVYGNHDSTGSGTGAAIYGHNAAASGVGYGIYGYNSSVDGWSGNFVSVSNGVVIQSANGSTGLVVNGGSKSASVPTSDGDRLLYNEESTEVWFSDYGNAQLEGGYALVTIDPVFAETVNLREIYHVFLQSYGDANLYVDKQTDTSFEVRSVSGSVDKNVAFSYRIVARRLGFEDARLELAPWVTEEQRFLDFPHPLAEPSLIDVVGAEQ